MSTTVRTSGVESVPDARERMLEAAYDLFSRRGIRAVVIDAIIERSGVAGMTLYRHFPSKDALVLAFLERREERWTRDWLQREVERRADEPHEPLARDLRRSLRPGEEVQRRTNLPSTTIHEAAFLTAEEV